MMEYLNIIKLFKRITVRLLIMENIEKLNGK